VVLVAALEVGVILRGFASYRLVSGGPDRDRQAIGAGCRQAAGRADALPRLKQPLGIRQPQAQKSSGFIRKQLLHLVPGWTTRLAWSDP